LLPGKTPLWHSPLIALTACPFCQPLPPGRVLVASDAFVAFLDGFPVTPGHTLVVPGRHVASFFGLPEAEYRELWAQVARVRSLLDYMAGPRFQPAVALTPEQVRSVMAAPL
jgi:hypothetical protein